jgi:hypothetical protein
MKTIIPSFAAADRRQARRLTPIAQGVFALSLLAGGGLAATTIFRPQPALTEAAPLSIPDLPPDPAFAKGAHASAGLSVEADSTAARWMLVKNRPVPAATQAPPTENPDQPPTTEPNTPPAPPGSVDRIRFLGVIRESRRMLALVSIEGRQRILAEGDSFTLVPGDTTQLKVVKITALELIVNDGSEDKSIKRAERTGLAVGTAAPGPAGAMSAGMLNNSMGVVQPPQYVTPPGINAAGMPAAQPINSREEYRRNVIAEKERRLREETEAAENAMRDAKLRELKGADPRPDGEKSEVPR